MNEDQIQEFIENGVVVIPNVISHLEVEIIQQKFHEFLFRQGCDVSNLIDTAGVLKELSSVGGAGGILDVFYQDFQLSLSQNSHIFEVMSSLWNETYATNRELFEHPYGNFDASIGYAYLDRLCFRVPEFVAEDPRYCIQKKKKQFKLQRSLTPHLDCCPHDMYQNLGGKEFPKWKPIQSFIALTDTVFPNMGGFEACPGFHKTFNSWTESRVQSPNVDASERELSKALCVGDFTPIRPHEDREVIERFRHIPCKAGDMVLWDYRIPHSNSRYNNSTIPREVVYIGYLPHTPMNRNYALNQLHQMRLGLNPTDQWISKTLQCQKMEFEFTELGKKLMCIEEWDA
jgi:hypothetical protein